MKTTHRKNVLFVCARNKIRSLTAEKMFSGSQLYNVKSRGVGRDARIRITEHDIGWADIVFVMEKNHKNRILEDFQGVDGDLTPISGHIKSRVLPLV